MDGLSWGRFEWRVGSGSYGFEIDCDGLNATFRPARAPAVTLPFAAWAGLIDAVGMCRSSETRTNARTRAGTGWTAGETAELTRGFAAGRSVAELARKHARSRWAVEGQLIKMGLLG